MPCKPNSLLLDRSWTVHYHVEQPCAFNHSMTLSCRWYVGHFIQVMTHHFINTSLVTWVIILAHRSRRHLLNGYLTRHLLSIKHTCDVIKLRQLSQIGKYWLNCEQIAVKSPERLLSIIKHIFRASSSCQDRCLSETRIDAYSEELIWSRRFPVQLVVVPVLLFTIPQSYFWVQISAC